jgi:ABC-type uncharacterized transport system permease subunit
VGFAAAAIFGLASGFFHAILTVKIGIDQAVSGLESTSSLRAAQDTFLVSTSLLSVETGLFRLPLIPSRPLRFQ